VPILATDVTCVCFDEVTDLLNSVIGFVSQYVYPQNSWKQRNIFSFASKYTGKKYSFLNLLENKITFSVIL
jgi:hypothetical protein